MAQVILIGMKRPHGNGSQISSNFLNDVATEFARLNVEFFKPTEEYPFQFGEKSVRYVLASAIARNDAVALTECRVTRFKENGDPGNGWLDFWVFHQRSKTLYLYMIEYKHITRNITTRSKVPEQHLWNDANTKLQRISGDYISITSTGCRRVFTVALFTIPIRQTAKTRVDLKPISVSDIEDLCEGVQKSLRPRPNWAALWTLHPRFQSISPLNDKKTRWGRFPAVMFVARTKQPL